MSEVLKGMIVSVYYNDSYRGCALGGPTETYDRVLLVGENVPKIFEDDGLTPVLEVKTKNVRGEYVYAEPVKTEKNKDKCFMMGGSFVYTSDSRFRSQVCAYPIPVHDRVE